MAQTRRQHLHLVPSPAARPDSPGGDNAASAQVPGGSTAVNPTTHRPFIAPRHLSAIMDPRDLSEIMDRPRDYDAPFTFVPSEVAPLTAGERLVLFFRLNGEALSFWFAIAAVGIALAVVGGAFVGWFL